MTKARFPRGAALFACAALAFLPAASFATTPKKASAPTAPVALKFGEIFKMPVGPAGLEPTDTVRSLDGKRVRMVGYVVEQEAASPTLLLSPLPVAVGDDDEGLADDLPPTTVAVRSASARGLPRVAGLVEVVGTLELGAREDRSSGRVTSIHIVAEPKAIKAVRAPRATPQDKAAAAKAASNGAPKP